MDTGIGLDVFLTQTLLALLLGSLIGLERQWHRRLVDLKTNALVCLGAALFIMTTHTAGGFVEPIRMAAQIVVGVGFIGGGLLFRDAGQTRGINTAATLWCCAAVGTLCGLGRLLEASLAALLLVVANTVLRDVARRLKLRMGLGDSLSEQVCFEAVCALPQDLAAVRPTLEQALLRRHGELRSVTELLLPSGQRQVTVLAAFESNDLQTDIDAVLVEAAAWPVLSMSWRRQ